MQNCKFESARPTHIHLRARTSRSTMVKKIPLRRGLLSTPVIGPAWTMTRQSTAYRGPSSLVKTNPSGPLLARWGKNVEMKKQAINGGEGEADGKESEREARGDGATGLRRQWAQTERHLGMIDVANLPPSCWPKLTSLFFHSMRLNCTCVHASASPNFTCVHMCHTARNPQVPATGRQYRQRDETCRTHKRQQLELATSSQGNPNWQKKRNE